MRVIDVTEGIPFSLSKTDGERLRQASERLRLRLRPSFSFLKESMGRFVLRNVIGSIDLGNGAVVQVAPKVGVTEDWTAAIVSLLTGQEKIEVAGERKAGVSRLHHTLLDAVASVYLRRLEQAYRQEGPILLMERRNAERPHLQGKLNVTKWARSALWRPHIFPVTRTELLQDNPFTKALLQVADTLAHASTNFATRNGLRALSRDLAAGMPRGGALGAAPTHQALPEQWSAYKPAWSLAVAVLSRTSLFGATGRHHGVGLAIEAWPLLETLLERTLHLITQIGQTNGRALTYKMQGRVNLLSPRGPGPHESFSPAPDGRLFDGDTLIASFEAKYSTFDPASPSAVRGHIYQAVCTAAACRAPLAVLVYPDAFAPCVWDIPTLDRFPRRLIAIGLGLFTWLPHHEARLRAQQLLTMIDELNVPPIARVIQEETV